jgi:hypothetical protein
MARDLLARRPPFRQTRALPLADRPLRVLTGKNVRLRNELARCCVRIRIDPKTDHGAVRFRRCKGRGSRHEVRRSP